MSSWGWAIYVVISISYTAFFGSLGGVFIALYIPPPMSVSDGGLPWRLCAFRPLLVATLKTEGKSIGCDFFEKNSLFFHPYIGIPVPAAGFP
jgi:hypothetical protein